MRFGMQVRRHPACLDRDKVSPDTVHNGLEDRDALEFAHSLVQNDTASARYHHGHQHWRPSVTEHLDRVFVGARHKNAQGDDKHHVDGNYEGRQPFVLSGV